MNFQIKKTLKSNRYHNTKQTLRMVYLFARPCRAFKKKLNFLFQIIFFLVCFEFFLML
jgi:hypothetical protein